MLSRWLSLKLFPCCSSSHSACVTLAPLLYLHATPQGFLHFAKSPPPETLVPNQLPHWPLVCFLTSSRSLVSNTLLYQADPPITQYKRARTTTINPTVIFPLLPPGTPIYLKIFSLSLLECKFQDGSLITLIYELLLACPDGEIQGHNTAHVQWNQAE